MSRGRDGDSKERGDPTLVDPKKPDEGDSADETSASTSVPTSGGPDGALAEAEATAPSAWAEKRPKYKKRITLELSGPMLALPGERPSMPSEAPSTVFRVPDEFRARALAGIPRDAPLPRETSGTNPEVNLGDLGPEGPPTPPVPLSIGVKTQNDGWGRADTNVARARSRSSTPPPANLFVSLDSNDALAMVGGTRKEAEAEVDFEREMQERYELGDFSGALRAAELVLGQKPSDARAGEYAEACRERLAALYLARLGGGARAIERAVQPSDVRWLGIDHRAGFMLSQIHGDTSIEELVDISGMPRHDALKLLVELVGSGAVRVR